MTLLSDQVYRELKRRLTLWEYEPGRRLSEDAIASEFAVSRTPVRDALRRLEREGLIEHEPFAGHRVPAPDLARMDELYEVRLALEEAAVRRLAEAGDHSGVRELLEAWEWPVDRPNPDPDLVFADEHFHETLAELAGNRFLWEVLRGINDRIQIIRLNDFVDPRRVEATYRQHRQILRAVLRRDADAAAARLRDHVFASQSFVRDAASRALQRMFSGRLPERREADHGQKRGGGR
jgi:DNA-binding GntR family transcriptional regulator